MSSILSVVRVRKVINHCPFEESIYNSKWWIDRFPEAERRKSWISACAHLDREAGLYIKSGGGAGTVDIQQAQIFGWSRKAKENLARFNKDIYEIIPILITPVTP